ncbi:MAG: acyltransferase [Lachnospiraceae bacterium]|nr:acyltransferase [Lachnospiraceae bacterium]
MEHLHKLYLAICAIPKTILFNFRYLPLKQAIKFPIIVSHRVAFQKMTGEIRIESPIRFNMIRIGFHENRSFDQKRERAVWHNEGIVIFKGTAYLGNGTRLANTGTLILGNNFQVSGNSSIICRHETTFGENVLIAWDCMFMDGDAHKVYQGSTLLNSERPILVGNRVWFDARCLVTKGATIPDGCVIAANSCIYKVFEEKNAIIGGYPARVIKVGIHWEA